MSTLIKILAPFLIRLLRRLGPSIPGINHAALERNRRKLTASLGWAAACLVSFLGSVLTAVIDAAVQYEQHGLVEYNVVLMGATAAFVFAIIAAFAARASLPNFNDLMDVGRRAKRSEVPGPRRPGFAR